MVLEVDNITKLYKNNRGASEIKFNVSEGEIFGLLGPNGSGKTTIMKIIMGLVRPQKGSVKIFGQDIYENPKEALMNVGTLIESPAIITYLSAYKNLKAIAHFYNETSDIDEILKLVGLSPYKNEKSSKFSLGMKQRLGIALSLIGNPKLLVLDEPTNGLDIEGTVEIRNLIKFLANEKKVTVLISSHLSSELQQICTKVGVVQNAKLVEVNDISYALENFNSLEDYFLNVVGKNK